VPITTEWTPRLQGTDELSSCHLASVIINLYQVFSACSRPNAIARANADLQTSRPVIPLHIHSFRVLAPSSRFRPSLPS